MTPRSSRLARTMLLASFLLAGCHADERRPAGLALEPVPAPLPLRVLGYRPASAFAWVDGERLLLGDADAGQLVISSVEGAGERRVGRRGAGPGEFLLLHRAVRARDGRILVADGTLPRITVFRPDWTIEATVPVRGRVLDLLAADGNRIRALWLPATGGPRLGILSLASGEVIESIAPLDRAPEIRDFASGARVPNPYLMAVLAHDGTVLAGVPTRYRLVGFRDGSIVRRIERDLPAEPLPATEVRAYERLLHSRGAPPAVRAQLLDAYRQRSRPFLGPVAVDGTGRLWIGTRRGDGRRTEIDVFAPDGAYLTTVLVPHDVRNLAIEGDRLAALVVRHGGPDDGTDGVDLYRIRGDG